MQPLAGITVVSLEQAIAAPFATRQLADLGARVIKVERPGVGDFARGYDTRVNGLSSHFVWTNRSKESLTLNVKDEAGHRILTDLLAEADVFVQNLAPGAATRMGLSFTDLHEAHPGLIVCDISGYGTGGPYEHHKAYDLMVQSEAGLLSVTGSPAETAKAGISVSDIAAGMYAYSGILAALFERGRTGLGSHLDVSMLEATVEWMGFPLYYAYDGATPPPRAGSAHATIYPYGPFLAGDGSTVMMAVQNEREWLNFCTTFLGDARIATRPEFSSNSARNDNRIELGQMISARFAQLTTTEAEALLDDVPLAHARVNDMHALWEHPQLSARERWAQVDTPAGPIPALLPPAFTETHSRMDPVPAVGEHTTAILEQLGLDTETVSGLRDRGVV